MIGVLRKMLILIRKAPDELLLVLIRQSVPDLLSMWTEVAPAVGRQL